MAKSALIFLLAVAVLAVVSQVSGVAHLFVVNGVSDFKANNSDLDIYINGTRVLCGFGYGQGAGYLALPAGLLLAQARRTPTIDHTDEVHHQILLEDDRHYALVASGSMTNSAQYALRLSGGRLDGPNDNSSKATLVFFNLAPGSGYLTLSVDDNVARLGNFFPYGKTMTKQFAPMTTHVLSLHDLDSTFLIKIQVKLQAGLNFFFALGDVAGGQPASLRAIQPSAAHAPSEC